MLLIGCGEVANDMFYNPSFEFVSIISDPSNTSSILELFDDVAGNMYYKPINDSGYFHIKNKDYYIHTISHVPYLAYQFKTTIICYGLPSLVGNENVMTPSCHNKMDLLFNVTSNDIFHFAISESCDGGVLYTHNKWLLILLILFFIFAIFSN